MFDFSLFTFDKKNVNDQLISITLDERLEI